MRFTEVFDVDGVMFGRLDGSIWRLPQKIGKRDYPLKRILPNKVCNKDRYLLRQRSLTMEQIFSRIKKLETPISIGEGVELPDSIK